jgi:hypothetical protein
LTLQHLFYHGCFPGNLTTVCLRRELVGPLGWFDESYRVSGDYEMWLRIARTHSIGVIHRHLVRVRVHREQLSARKDSGVRFVAENRRIRREILPLLPPRARSGAARFEHWRHDVLDFHFSLRCLLAGRWLAFARVARAMGLWNWLRGGALWLWTGNNRRHRPQADWILPDSPPRGGDSATGTG